MRLFSVRGEAFHLASSHLLRNTSFDIPTRRCRPNTILTLWIGIPFVDDTAWTASCAMCATITRAKRRSFLFRRLRNFQLGSDDPFSCYFAAAAAFVAVL